MKKLVLLMCICTLTILNMSCDRDFGDSGTIPMCDFSGTEDIFFTEFGLRLPNIQYANVAFNNAFNVGATIYDLNTVLDPKGDYRY